MLFKFAFLWAVAFTSEGRSQHRLPHMSRPQTLREVSRLITSTLSSPDRVRHPETPTVRDIANTISRNNRRTQFYSFGNETPHSDIENSLSRIFEKDEILQIDYLEDGGVAIKSPWIQVWCPDMAEACVMVGYMVTSGLQIEIEIVRKVFYVISGLVFNAAMTKEFFPLYLYFTTAFYTNFYMLFSRLNPQVTAFLFEDKWWGLAIENAIEEVLKISMVGLGYWGTTMSKEKLALFAGLGFATFESLNYVETHLHTVGAMASRFLTFLLHPAFTTLAIKFRGAGFFMAWMIHFWYDAIACNFMPQIQDICPTDILVFILALLLRKGIMQLQEMDVPHVSV